MTVAYDRGFRDAVKGRSPIFRSTRAFGIVAETGDPLSDEWDDESRKDYLDGYADGGEHGEEG